MFLVHPYIRLGTLLRLNLFTVDRWKLMKEQRQFDERSEDFLD